MRELALLFKEYGLTDEKNVREALTTLSDEYNRLTESQVRTGAKHHAFKAFAVPLSKSLLELFITIVTGSQYDAVAPVPVVGKLATRLSQGSNFILDRISQMIKAEDTSAFNSVKDYAQIAAHVYGNRRDDILPAAWRCLGNSYMGLKLDDKKSGLVAALYRKNGVSPKYVYAIAGTRGMDIKDWKANLGQVAGISNQYDRAGEISEKLARVFGSKNITIVGHSKGGGQAAYGAMRTGCRAITFNPAGLGMTKFKHVKYKQADINSYVLLFDPLNLMQMLAQLYYADLTADGTVHYLKCDKNSPVKEWHGIDGFLRLAGMKDMHRIA